MSLRRGEAIEDANRPSPKIESRATPSLRGMLSACRFSTSSRAVSLNEGGCVERVRERTAVTTRPLQHQLELPRQLPGRARRARRPFHPSTGEGAYRLPHEVRDRLIAALQPYRNRGAAFALAVFLARFWSMPGRVALPFVVDRVALADRQDLGLSEARVRGAIKTLEAIGFLERWPTTGSAYRATEDGLRRKPVGFTFGLDYMPAFIAANKRAAAARGGRPPERRATLAGMSRRPSPTTLEARPLKSPERSEAERTVYLGEIVKKSGMPPKSSASDPKLEAALDGLLGPPSPPVKSDPGLESALARLAEGVFGIAEAKREGQS